MLEPGESVRAFTMLPAVRRVVLAGTFLFLWAVWVFRYRFSQSACLQFKTPVLVVFAAMVSTVTSCTTSRMVSLDPLEFNAELLEIDSAIIKIGLRIENHEADTLYLFPPGFAAVCGRMEVGIIEHTDTIWFDGEGLCEIDTVQPVILAPGEHLSQSVSILGRMEFVSKIMKVVRNKQDVLLLKWYGGGGVGDPVDTSLFQRRLSEKYDQRILITQFDLQN